MFQSTNHMHNKIIQGDAINVLAELPADSIDLVVTDPPYLVNYLDRDGRQLLNDNNPDGVLPVFEPLVKALKQNAFIISFCGWSAMPQFTQTWDRLGLKIVSQIVWKKSYISRSGYTNYAHETAYVLTKGNPEKPQDPLCSVQEWVYSGNKYHPTEKSVENLIPIIKSFSKPGDLICDPFSGSGSSCVAAALSERNYLGIDIDEKHCISAQNRLLGVSRYLENRAERVA